MMKISSNMLKKCQADLFKHLYLFINMISIFLQLITTSETNDGIIQLFMISCKKKIDVKKINHLSSNDHPSIVKLIIMIMKSFKR